MEKVFLSTLTFTYYLWFVFFVVCLSVIQKLKFNLVDASSSKNGVPTPVRSVTTSVTAQVSKLIPNSSATNQSSSAGVPSSSSAPGGSGGGECSLCPLCRKTQLARGCGHKCGFCSTLFCSRCGAKTQVYLQKGFRITDGGSFYSVSYELFYLKVD